MFLPRFLPSLWGPLNKVSVGFMPRGCLKLCLSSCWSQHVSLTHTINVTHPDSCYGCSISFCLRACFSWFVSCMSIYPIHHVFLWCQKNCHCNVCDIKWTKLKLQVPSSICFSLSMTIRWWIDYLPEPVYIFGVCIALLTTNQHFGKMWNTSELCSTPSQCVNRENKNPPSTTPVQEL